MPILLRSVFWCAGVVVLATLNGPLPAASGKNPELPSDARDAVAREATWLRDLARKVAGDLDLPRVYRGGYDEATLAESRASGRVRPGPAGRTSPGTS